MTKIENKKAMILPDEASFNDEDIIQDVLISLKNLNTLYGLLKQEASNESLINKVDTLCKENFNCTRNCFNLIFEKGFYALEEQNTTKITEEYNKFNNKIQYFN